MHCARLHRRLTFPLNLSLHGKVFPLVNWSLGGMLIRCGESEIRRDTPENGEILIPCSDGVYSLNVRFTGVRRTPEGWGVQFVDLPPRERSIIHFYADALLRGEMVAMEELDEAAKIPAAPIVPPGLAPLVSNTLPTDADAETEEGMWERLRQVPSRHWLLLSILTTVVIVIGFFVIPYLVGSVHKKFARPAEFLKIAESRVAAAEIGLRDIDQKIVTVREMLTGPEQSSLTSEQRRALELGLAQLEIEREMARVHLGVLETNRDLIKKGDLLIEESIFSGYNTDTRSVPAPYLDQVVSSISANRNSVPQSPEERKKFEAVAQARVRQAEFSLNSTTIKRKALADIVTRAEKAGPASALPQNTLEILKRDLALLEIEEKRLEDVLALLRDNLEAVKKGSFTYETQLLQKFDPAIVSELPRTEASTTR